MIVISTLIYDSKLFVFLNYLNNLNSNILHYNFIKIEDGVNYFRQATSLVYSTGIV